VVPGSLEVTAVQEKRRASANVMNHLPDSNESAVPPFVGIVNVLHGPRHACLDVDGRALHGIRGIEGANATLDSGLQLGIDRIEIAPGSGFEPHTHEGAHILFGLAGRGELLFAGQTFVIEPGDTVYVPAHVPHAVRSSKTSRDDFSFLAVGYPHKKVHSPDRMQLVREGFPR
jgi:quercetin dioxygenase-like cupin family protein